MMNSEISFTHLVWKAPAHPTALHSLSVQRRIMGCLLKMKGLKVHRFYFEQFRLEALISSSTPPGILMTKLQSHFSRLKLETEKPQISTYLSTDVSQLRMAEAYQSLEWAKEIFSPLPDQTLLLPQPTGSMNRFKIRQGHRILFPHRKTFFLGALN